MATNALTIAIVSLVEHNQNIEDAKKGNKARFRCHLDRGGLLFSYVPYLVSLENKGIVVLKDDTTIIHVPIERVVWVTDEVFQTAKDVNSFF